MTTILLRSLLLCVLVNIFFDALITDIPPVNNVTKKTVV